MNSQKMKILITGGAGFIGSHLTEALQENNEIIVFDNLKRKIKEPGHPNVTLIRGDIRNYEELEKIGPVDQIYHLAAQSNVIGSSEDPNYAILTNVNGTYNVLKYATKVQAKNVMFFSSREVYGNPESVPVDENGKIDPANVYGSTKAAGEMLCKTFQEKENLSVTIIRIANAYGKGDKDRVIPLFLEKIKNNEPIVLYGGDQILDFVHIDDIIQIILELSKPENQGKTINIGTGVGTSVKELANLLKKEANSDVAITQEAPRSIDVKGFTAKSIYLQHDYKKLEEGIKELVQND